MTQQERISFSRRRRKSLGKINRELTRNDTRYANVEDYHDDCH